MKHTLLHLLGCYLFMMRGHGRGGDFDDSPNGGQRHHTINAKRAGFALGGAMIYGIDHYAW